MGEYNEVLTSRITLSDCVWQPFERPVKAFDCQGKIRSQSRPAACRVLPLPGGKVQVEFSEPQRAPTPGQSCVLYEGELLLGGGFIEPPKESLQSV